MKLEDIDKLNELRTEFNRRRYQLNAVTHSPTRALSYGDHTINDTDILNAVREMIKPMLQKKMDEAKTKLMMLGVDEFPQ